MFFPSLEWTNPCWLQRSGGKLPASSYKSGQKKGRERSQAGFESLPIPSGWIHQRIYKKRGIWAAQGIKLILLLAYRMIKQCCSRIRNLCYLRNLFHSILHYLGNTFHTWIVYNKFWMLIHLFGIVHYLTFSSFRILKCLHIFFGENLGVLWRF